MTDYLIGADIGGTSTRVAVADRSGRVVAVATSGAGNPNAVGLDTSAARIHTTVRTALERVPEPGPTAAVVLGMAGYRRAQQAGADFLDACLPAQLQVRPRIVADLGVAFASATPLPRGSVVIAGTGSATAEIDHGEILARRGGWGWLLGDEGAGFWLGREAVRHALTEVERGQARSPLTSAVLAQLASSDPDDGVRDALTLLLGRPYEQPPLELAELAPLVTGLVDQDPAAVAISLQAAERLARLLLDLPPHPGLPIVTTGSVLQPTGPIHRAFTERVGPALGAPILSSTSGLVGAVWLAAHTATDGTPAALGTPPDPSVHERLLATVSSTETDPRDR